MVFDPGVRIAAIRCIARGLRPRGGPDAARGDWNLEFGGSPNAQGFVPSRMFRKGAGDVQHVMATQRHFGFVSTRTMRLNWTDHPGFQVYLDKR